MANTHQEWLRQLKASHAQAGSIYQWHLQASWKVRVTEKPAHPFRGAPDFWQAFEWPMEERIERFTGNFQSAGGHVARLSTMEDAKRFIAGQSEEMSAKYIIRQNQPELDDLDLEGALPDAIVSVWNRVSERIGKPEQRKRISVLLWRIMQPRIQDR